MFYIFVYLEILESIFKVNHLVSACNTINEHRPLKAVHIMKRYRNF